MTDISNMDDIIDSRDVIQRIEELRNGQQQDEGLSLSEHEELQDLTALAEEASDYAPDWEHGEALIRDSYFQEYAEQFAEDCGLIIEGASWPNNCIDWERAARELQYDYTAVEFDGVTYWIR